MDVQKAAETSSAPTPSGAAEKQDVATILNDARQERAGKAPAPPQTRQRRDESDAASPGDASDERKAPLSALHSERKQRRAAQERVAELERQLQETLAQNVPPSQEQPQQENSFWIDPDAALKSARMESNYRHSKAEFLAEYGRGALNELDGVLTRVTASGHPDLQSLALEMAQSGDPIGVAREWAETALGWKPGQQQQAQGQRPAPVFPSNLANARNVGVRTGPAWGGPESIASIFAERRSAINKR